MLGKLIKWLVALAFVGGILLAASYAGVRFKVGEILGPQPPKMGTRTITLGYDSVPGQPGKQVIWTFAWSPTPWTGRRPARIWVTPTGKVVRMEPRNLEALIEQYYKDKERI